MKNVILLLTVFLLSACSTSPIGSDFEVRDYDEVKLSNGLKVLLIKDNSLPYISAGLLVKIGQSNDPDGKSGLTSFVAQLMSRGTQNYKAPELAEELGKLGTEFSASVDTDYTLFSMGTLSQHEDRLLELFGEIMGRQSFNDNEIRRLKRQTVSSIKKSVDDPSSFADILYEAYIYGPHPYGRTINGTVSSVRSIQRKDIIRHYLKYFRPNNATLAVVGNFDKDIKSRLEKHFADWTKRDTKAEPLPEVEKVEGRKIRLVNKPDLVQAQIRLGHIGIKRSDPDFLKLRVANTILGSGFVSRLMDEIRDNLGLTYSIRSQFHSRLWEGPFVVSTFTKNKTVGKTVQETLRIIEEFKEQGVTEEEVNSAKNYLLGVFPQAIDTPEKLAFNLLILDFFGISRDYLDNYVDNISDITTQEVNQAIKKHFTPENIKILVYANSQKVIKQLKPVGEIESRVYSEFR